MTTFHLLLADAGVLLAVLSALLAACAWGIATWGQGLRDMLTQSARAWAALAVGLLASALSVPATFAGAQGWRFVCVVASSIAFLWHAAFAYGAVRRVAGLGPFPFGSLRGWLSGYAAFGTLSGLLLLGGPALLGVERASRVVGFGWCAMLYLRGAQHMLAGGGWRQPHRALLGAGGIGTAAALVWLSALLPAFVPGGPPMESGLWLPLLALTAFMLFAIGTMLHIVTERRALDAAQAAALAGERQRAESSTAHLDAAMAAIGDGAVQLDLDRRLEAWNAAFARMAVARGTGPMVGQRIEAWLDDDARRAWEAVWCDVSAGRMAHGRFAWPQGEGRRTIDLSAAPTVQDGAVVGGIAVLRDITDLVELEERFHHAQRNEAVGRLAYGVAHDFNNLLSALTMTLELAEDDPDPATVLRDAHAIAERGRTLTRQLLDFARRRPEEGPDVFMLRARIDGLLRVLQRLLGGQVQMIVPPIDPALQVKMPAGHFDQVLLNLVVNARDAMPEGGTITVRVTATPDDGPIVLRVSDTGVGMPPDVMARALEPYFTTKGAGTGTGLGLSTCRDLVTQAGGTLALESVHGRGTTVIVELPRAGASSALAAAPAAAEPAAAPRVSPPPGSLAVIADDDPLVLRSVDRTLQRHGYRTIACADGAAALEAIRATGPVSLIVSDVLMPRLDGPSWVREARAAGCTAPVLFVSGYDGQRLDGDLLESLRAGFLPKPFTSAELVEAVAARRPSAPT